MIGTIFLVVGSFTVLYPIIWSKDEQPPSLKRDYKHLFERNYGLVIPGQDFGKDSDILEYKLGMTAKYPILRLKAAEFGPWLLFIGFVLQLYAASKGP